MTERIPLRYTVAVQGFNEAERGVLASFFRLAAQRAPAYVHASFLTESDFVIADADQPASVQAVQQAGRLADTVFVGQTAPDGAAACVPRPVEPSRLVHELDGLCEQRLAGLDEPATGEWMPEVAEVVLGQGDRPAKDVLVVDDSRIALKFLEVRLQRLGYRVHLAANAQEALPLLAAQPFSLVFLDVTLGTASTLDGLSLCQHIKQRREHPGGMAPRVVMVTALATSTDRVRGDLAGCDAYLTKPLMEEEFLATLKLLDPAPA